MQTDLIIEDLASRC